MFKVVGFLFVISSLYIIDVSGCPSNDGGSFGKIMSCGKELMKGFDTMCKKAGQPNFAESINQVKEVCLKQELIPCVPPEIRGLTTECIEKTKFFERDVCDEAVKKELTECGKKHMKGKEEQMKKIASDYKGLATNACKDFKKCFEDKMKPFLQ